MCGYTHLSFSVSSNPTTFDSEKIVFKTYNDFTVFFNILSALRSFFSRMTMTMTSTVIMTAAATTTTDSTPPRAAVADDDELDDVVSLVSAHVHS